MVVFLSSFIISTMKTIVCFIIFVLAIAVKASSDVTLKDLKLYVDCKEYVIKVNFLSVIIHVQIDIENPPVLSLS